MDKEEKTKEGTDGKREEHAEVEIERKADKERFPKRERFADRNRERQRNICHFLLCN